MRIEMRRSTMPPVISVTPSPQVADLDNIETPGSPVARGASRVPDGAALARERGVHAGIARFAGRPRGVGSVVRGRAIG